MDLNKVLFITQEIAPYLPETPMSVFTRELAQGVQEKGIEVRTFSPKYVAINERRNQLHEVIRLSGMNLIIDDTDHPLIIKVATLQPSRLQVYFIYNEDYFETTSRNASSNATSTKELETKSSPEDNDERSIFYVRGVLETVKKLRWMPPIIQCSGLITALAPLYIKKLYGDDPSFRDTRVVFALHGDEFPQPLDARLAEKLAQDGIDEKALKNIAGKPVDTLALTRLALEHSDAVVQCTPELSPEILELVKKSKLPFLPYEECDSTQALVDRYLEFYQTL